MVFRHEGGGNSAIVGNYLRCAAGYYDGWWNESQCRINVACDLRVPGWMGGKAWVTKETQACKSMAVL